MKLKVVTRLGLASCLCVSSFNIFAASDTDTQTLSINVPLIALIDVEETSPTITVVAPTNAGEGFDGSSTSTDKNPKIAISSNNTDAKLNVKIDTDLSPFGFTLELTELSGELGSCIDGLRLTTTNKQLCDIGLRQTSNGQVLIKASMDTVNTMIPYGSYTTNIVYTISEN
jgi:hypothetical protein